MLKAHIAEKIHTKVAGLISQPLSVVSPEGGVLATNDSAVDESLDPAASAAAIDILYAGRVVGYVVFRNPLANQDEIEPLIRSIAELIMHQAILIDKLPRQEERLDKFVYDLLSVADADGRNLANEASLFDIDLSLPRTAIVLYVEDPLLTGQERDTGDREMRITRCKFNLSRALNSYYTSSRNNIISYLGHNSFCVLKDLTGDNSDIHDGLDKFKKSINTIYDIFKSELKLPVTVGIGNYHHGIDGLRTSYQEAISAIELGQQNWDKDRVYHIDDFGVVAPLLSGVDEHNIYFSRELLDKLDEADGVIDTLESFFKNNMGLTQTASELGIHRNTLVYRLDRITETLGLDPRQFDDAVQIKLALLFTKFVETP